MVWLGLAALALLPATRAPQAISRMIASMVPGEPAWLAWLDTHGAGILTRHGPAASILLAAVLAAIALTPLTLARPPRSARPARPGRPPRLARAAILLALAVAATLWLAQGLGGIFTGTGTDPGTGPLLALLALAYWRCAAPLGPAPPGPRSAQRRPSPRPSFGPAPPRPLPCPRRVPDVAGPAWLTGVFAALMLTVAVYCAGRLAAARRWHRPTEVDTDAGHVLMGVAMAGMLVARLRVVPATAWEAVFAVGAAWFAGQLLRARRRPRPAAGAVCTRPPTWSSAPRCSTCSRSCLVRWPAPVPVPVPVPVPGWPR